MVYSQKSVSNPYIVYRKYDFEYADEGYQIYFLILLFPGLINFVTYICQLFQIFSFFFFS